MEERHCELCGAVFYAEPYSIKRFCCETHRKKASIGRAKNNREADDSRIAEIVRTRAHGWEYVGGYTGSDGTVKIRHTVCGAICTKSIVTIRHHRELRCERCKELKAETEAKAKAMTKAEKNEKALEARKRRRAELLLPKAKPIVKCRVCGQKFYGKTIRSSVCSDECQHKLASHYWAMKKDARRRKAQTKETKTITLPKLFERDGGICWICGEPCDITAHYNANNYPSVDHLIPISKGGKDEWANIKLAHRICNSLRGNYF